MTGSEIVKRAYDLQGYVYWYGGKMQKCTERLAKTMRVLYPSVWTSAYYAKAMKDVAAGKSCADCSALVCHAYNIPMIGSYQIRAKYKTWTGKPKPGMIGWKKGHVGIIKDKKGHLIEMRGIDYDFQDTRYRSTAGCKTLLYDPNVDYDN